jgi:hypothetical protein
MKQARELRTALNREREAGRGKGKQGFSAGPRQRVVEFLRRERASGRRADDLIAAVGLSRPTFYAWAGTKTTPQQAFWQLTYPNLSARFEGRRSSARARDVDPHRLA